MTLPLLMVLAGLPLAAFVAMSYIELVDPVYTLSDPYPSANVSESNFRHIHNGDAFPGGNLGQPSELVQSAIKYSGLRLNDKSAVEELISGMRMVTFELPTSTPAGSSEFVIKAEPVCDFHVISLSQWSWWFFMDTKGSIIPIDLAATVQPIAIATSSSHTTQNNSNLFMSSNTATSLCNSLWSSDNNNNNNKKFKCWQHSIDGCKITCPLQQSTCGHIWFSIKPTSAALSSTFTTPSYELVTGLAQETTGLAVVQQVGSSKVTPGRVAIVYTVMKEYRPKEASMIVKLVLLGLVAVPSVGLSLYWWWLLSGRLMESLRAWRLWLYGRTEWTALESGDNVKYQ